MRIVPLRGGGGTPPQGDLFTPEPIPAPREPERDERREPAPVRGRPPLLLVVAVLLALVLGVSTSVALGVPEEAASRGAPRLPGPAPRSPGTGASPEITVARGEEGMRTVLPTTGAADWVAPGARRDGSLVRADVRQESIEFRAANTQPGLPAPFRTSWTGGKAPHRSGDATTMLGVRPGGRVEFVIRPLRAPADLVLHVSGTDVAVTVGTGDDVVRRTGSAPMSIVTVVLPGDRAAIVSVTAAGNNDVGVTTAELVPR